MTTLEVELPTPSTKIPNYFVYGLIVFSGLGFLDATYLTVKHYLGTSLACAFFTGCEQVTTSVYSTVAGIPVALLGAVYYLVVCLLIIAYLDTRRGILVAWAAKLTAVGLAASAVFVFLQIFVIHELCFYCLASAVSSTVLFILGQWFLNWKKNHPDC